MRVAIFTNAYKPIVSGVVNSIELIKDALTNKGHEVCIFAPRFDDYTDVEENVYRYLSVDLTRKVKFPIAIPLSLKISNVLNDFKPDIIHTHHPFVLGKAAYHYARKLDIPLVFTFHTQYEMYSHYVPLPDSIIKYSCRKTIRSFSEKSDCTITPASSIAELLKTYGIQKQIKVIPNAIDLKAYKSVLPDEVNRLKDEYGLKGKKVILFVGRIAPEKNLIFLIDAYKKTLQKLPDTRLMIVGDGPQLTELKAYAGEVNISQNIVFTGRIDYKKIPAFYKLADIFAIASTTEVKPLVILEALAAGLPVVAVNAPGAKDTITDQFDGILTGVDIQDFSAGIVRALKEEVLYKKLKRGAEETSDKYSIDNVSDEIINLYEELIRSKDRLRTSLG